MKAVIDYKNRIASRYRALSKDQIGFRIIDSETYFVSKKIDGHFAGLSIKNGVASLHNRTGKELEVKSIIAEAAKLFPDENIILAGELYVDNKAERARSFHVSEALGSPNKFPLRFAVFDIISQNDEIKLSPGELVQYLAKLIPGNGLIHFAETQIAKSKNEITTWYDTYVEKQKHEGIVVRSQEGFIYKVKPTHSFDVVIIGYAEGEDEREGMLRSVLTAFMKSDGSFHVGPKVGSGFTEEQRRTILNQLKTMHVPSEYTEVADNHAAFQMVRPEIVIECSFLDLLPEVGGRVSRKMDLTHDGTTGYAVVGAAPSVVMISPVFESIRTDKQVNVTDIRFKQITDLIDISPETDHSSLPKSTLLKREVYVKETKGEKAIRKFLLWKTNKEQSEDFPPYIVYYTDFSAGRKDMLQQEMNIAQTEKEAETLFAASVAENVKKGWNKVG